MEDKRQTQNIFSDKWELFENNCDNKNSLCEKEKNRYLELYGFKNERELSDFLKSKNTILDAGCGVGYKTAWFAELSPRSTIYGVDFSDSINIAKNKYRHLKNLTFIKYDLMECASLIKNKVDYISCDQVLHHTENPDKVIKEFNKLISNTGEIALYVYRKKSIPRELLDDFFRKHCKTMDHTELLDLSKQLTKLGEELSKIETKITIPDIPALKISKGTYNVQRFIYYNFLKCYWDEKIGFDNSTIFNYDWYSPSIAKRYTMEEFFEMISNNGLEQTFIYEDAACFSRRFVQK